MGYSQSRVGTHVPCLGSWLVNHYTLAVPPFSITCFCTVAREYTCMIAVFSTLLRHVLWPNIWSIMENIPCALEKNVYSVYWRSCLSGLVAL